MLINEYFKLIFILIILSFEIFYLLKIKRVINIFKIKYMLLLWL